jgi:hypothetical protein
VGELSQGDLDELVEEAIVDAYGEDEQLAGFYTMIEENLALPFTTRVLGLEVTVEGIDLTDCGITAICVRGTHRQPIAILDLPLLAIIRSATRPRGLPMAITSAAIIPYRVVSAMPGAGPEPFPHRPGRAL